MEVYHRSKAKPNSLPNTEIQRKGGGILSVMEQGRIEVGMDSFPQMLQNQTLKTPKLRNSLKYAPKLVGEFSWAWGYLEEFEIRFRGV